jgi:serine/threonine protein kinase
MEISKRTFNRSCSTSFFDDTDADTDLEERTSRCLSSIPFCDTDFPTAMHSRECIAYKKGLHIDLKKPLGEGFFASVYPASNLKNPKKELVVKLIWLKTTEPEDSYNFVVDDLEREYRFLQRLQNASLGIVRAPKIFYKGKKYSFLALEKYDCSLEDALPRLDLNKKTTYFYQILEGLNYAHQVEIAHGDIKLSNCLVKENICVLADFGNASYECEVASGWAVGEYYPKNACDIGKALRANYLDANSALKEETLKIAHQYQCSQDIYAIGILMTKIFTGEDISSELKKLIQEIQEPNWKIRLKISEVLKRYKVLQNFD